MSVSEIISSVHTDILFYTFSFEGCLEDGSEIHVYWMKENKIEGEMNDIGQL